MSDIEGQGPIATEEVESSADSLEERIAQLEAERTQLRRENAKHRVAKQQKEAELEEFRTWKESQKTELERAAERAAQAEKELKNLRAEKIQRDIAKEVGLDPDLADRIRGESEEEMLEDAKLLAKKYGSKPSVDVYAGRRGVPVGANAQQDPNQAFNTWVRNS